MRRKSSRTDDADFSNNNKTDQLLLDDAAQPSKLNTLYTSTSTNITTDSSTIQQQHSLSDDTGSVDLTERSWDRDCRREGVAAA